MTKQRHHIEDAALAFIEANPDCTSGMIGRAVGVTNRGNLMHSLGGLLAKGAIVREGGFARFGHSTHPWRYKAAVTDAGMRIARDAAAPGFPPGASALAAYADGVAAQSGREEGVIE